MVGRLIRALLILLILLTCSLIPVLLIKQHFTDDILKNSKLLVQATSKLVELQVLRKIEDSFRAPSQVPTHYIDLARKLGGLFFYDENSRKVVTCIRNEQEVQASLVHLMVYQPCNVLCNRHSWKNRCNFRVCKSRWNSLGCYCNHKEQ